MNLKALGTAVALSASIMMTACVPVQQAGQQVELQFVTHPAAGMAEQDVFVPSQLDGEIVRAKAEEVEQYMDTIVLASTERIEHDPLAVGDAPFGPYTQGAELGFTMGEWLAGSGVGTYTVVGGKAEMNFTFSNLIPNGVYTFWCSRMTLPPNFQVVDLPCGAEDGSESIAIADSDGNMSYSLTLDALELSDEANMAMIAVAYHSDGQTYGAYPGDFGLNSHIQVVGMLPTSEDPVWQTVNVGP